MTPRAVLERWISRFNAGDVDGLAALYAEDATNHQVALEPVVGRAAIRAMFAREFAAASMLCIPDRIHEAGDVVALEWKDPNGLRGSGFFTIREGLITFQRGYWDQLSFRRLRSRPGRLADWAKSFRIRFDDTPWDQVRPDVRQKVHCDDARIVRLVEFDTTDGPEDWCEAGHIGYVLEGALSVSFNGEVISYVAGDVMLIPAGPSTKHRATSITQGTQLLMIEDA